MIQSIIRARRSFERYTVLLPDVKVFQLLSLPSRRFKSCREADSTKRYSKLQIAFQPAEGE